MYVNKLTIAGDVVLVSNYAPRAFGAPGKRRRKKLKETPEAMAKYNRRKRAEKLQLLMILNFDLGYHITLDYPKDNRPQTYEEAEENLKKFLRKMTRRTKKVKKFKYIAITERGKKREALHHHMVVEGDPLLLREITKVWGNHIKISQMYEEGEYKDLADYFTKVETKEEQTKGRSKYHRSRNLKEPVVKSRIVVGKIDDDPYVPKGYDLIEDSVVNGFNDFIFMKYQSYMIRKRKKPEPPKRPEPISEQKGSRHVGIWESIKKIFRKKGAR